MADTRQISTIFRVHSRILLCTLKNPQNPQKPAILSTL
jgi:hypothetical protein